MNVGLGALLSLAPIGWVLIAMLCFAQVLPLLCGWVVLRIVTRMERDWDDVSRLHERARDRLRSIEAKRDVEREAVGLLLAIESEVGGSQRYSVAQKMDFTLKAQTCQLHVAEEILATFREQSIVDVAIRRARAYTTRMEPWLRFLIGASNLAERATMFLDGPTDSRGDTIIPPPAANLCRVLRFFCSTITYDEIVWPIVADMHDDYFRALDAGRSWKARWEYVKGVLNVLRQLGLFVMITRIVNVVERCLRG